MSEQTKPREWWIETHETMRFKRDINGNKSWPRVYESNVGYAIHVIEKSAFDAQALEIEKLKAMIEILYSKQSQHESTVLATVAERDRLRAELAEHKDCREISKTLGDLLNNQQSKLDRLSQANEILKKAVTEQLPQLKDLVSALFGNHKQDELNNGTLRRNANVACDALESALAEDAKLESESGE